MIRKASSLRYQYYIAVVIRLPGNAEFGRRLMASLKVLVSPVLSTFLKRTDVTETYQKLYAKKYAKVCSQRKQMKWRAEVARQFADRKSGLGYKILQEEEDEDADEEAKAAPIEITGELSTATLCKSKDLPTLVTPPSANATAGESESPGQKRKLAPGSSDSEACRH